MIDLVDLKLKVSMSGDAVSIRSVGVNKVGQHPGQPTPFAQATTMPMGPKEKGKGGRRNLTLFDLVRGSFRNRANQPIPGLD